MMKIVNQLSVQLFKQSLMYFDHLKASLDIDIRNCPYSS